MKGSKEHPAEGARIYNLFPRLAGPLTGWKPHLNRAAGLGFNWLYLNPIFYSGFSGSIYSIKEYRWLDPVIVDPYSAETPEEQLRSALSLARTLGLRPMIDLVINHTAIDGRSNVMAALITRSVQAVKARPSA